MQNYSTPCYTLAETMEILGFRQSELHHAIRSNNLKAVLYTKARNILLFRRDESDQWIGAATCTYRGHVLCHSSYITSLLDEPKIYFDRSSFRLLDENGISNWSIGYPFKRPVPHLPVIDWQPIDQNSAIGRSQTIAKQYENWPIGQNTPLYVCAATPLPTEYENQVKALTNWLDKLNKTREYEPLHKGATDSNLMELDFRTNSVFTQEDLRIPASEIARYKEQLSEQDKARKIAEVITPETTYTQRRRDSQLHDIIERIIEKKPDISAKDAWSIIQKDSELDDPLFDIDHILEKVDANCIEWTSRNGSSQSMTWGSFQAKLSQIKKRVSNT